MASRRLSSWHTTQQARGQRKQKQTRIANTYIFSRDAGDHAIDASLERPNNDRLGFVRENTTFRADWLSSVSVDTQALGVDVDPISSQATNRIQQQSV